jgi:hypothetical protein
VLFSSSAPAAFLFRQNPLRPLQNRRPAELRQALQLPNQLTQRAIARECADWIRRKVTFRSNATKSLMQQMACIQPTDREADVYFPLQGFTAVDLGYQQGSALSNIVNKFSGAAMTDGYLRLMSQVIRSGVKTKVLMLSATPVNNRFADLKNQLALANEPIQKTLRPARDESVDFDTTRNLYLEGDNLDALKLLQETYLGQVKMMCIDPPYNTGKDFIYDDDFSMSRGEYQESAGEVDDKAKS